MKPGQGSLSEGVAKLECRQEYQIQGPIPAAVSHSLPHPYGLREDDRVKLSVGDVSTEVSSLHLPASARTQPWHVPLSIRFSIHQSTLSHTSTPPIHTLIHSSHLAICSLISPSLPGYHSSIHLPTPSVYPFHLTCSIHPLIHLFIHSSPIPISYQFF